MGKYSSDSDSSPSSRRRKSGKSSHRRSSSRSSSGSHYSSKCRKGKKYKKSRRSRSKEKRSKSSREGSRERDRGRRRGERDGGGERRRSKERRKGGGGRGGSRGRSPPPAPRRAGDDSALMERLNKAAVEAMKMNKVALGGIDSSLESQMERERAIKEINSTGFVQKSFLSNTLPGGWEASKGKGGSKDDDDSPILVEFPSLPTQPKLQTSQQASKPSNSLLHQNLLMENQEEKLNRWVRKLFQIRQRFINGEPMQLA